MSQEEPSRAFHIAIVGNVGTDKSTLARLLQKRLGCSLYLEEPQDYPFLRLFFVAPHHWCFANQLQFVMTKFAQQAQIRHHSEQAIQEMDALATYVIWTPACREMGYMSQAETATIGRVYEHLAASLITTPDLRVVLQASLPTVMDRISKRGRDYEELDPEFVRLIAILDRNIAQFSRDAAGNLMTVDTEAVDFTRSSRTRDALVDSIVSQLPG